MQMKPLEELFGISDSEEERAAELLRDQNFQILNLDPAKVRDFQKHPFEVKIDEDMAELVESVRKNGVLNPGIARRMPDGGYEALSGHRRKKACMLAGISSMPFIIGDYSDEEAVIIMVESNIQRSHISVREKAFSYRMHMDAQKRLNASKRDKDADQDAEPRRSDAILARKTGESRNTIQRYIRLTYLIPALLDLADAGKLPLITASDLSYLKKTDQETVLSVMQQYHVIPSGGQAKVLKEWSRIDNMTADKVHETFRADLIQINFTGHPVKPLEIRHFARAA